MRLSTKINLYFGIILIIVMLAVFLFNQYFFQKELEAETQDSLRVTYQSFIVTIDNMIKEQRYKASAQTRREVFAFSIAQKIPSVLNFYFRQVARDFNLDLIEAIDRDGYLLADQRLAYETQPPIVNFKRPAANGDISYLSQRESKVYLVTTIPALYDGRIVGYINLGTKIDEQTINNFSSLLHSKMLLFGDGQRLLGSPRVQTIPEAVYGKLQKHPQDQVFQSGSRMTDPNYYFIFFSIPTDASFQGTIAIAKSRAGEVAALWRLKIFSTFVVGLGLLFGILGAILLTRNIKQSIFGMEPQEIAALLDQRTAILQSTFEGIIALDQRGRVTWINQEAAKMLAPGCEVVGNPVSNIFKELNLQTVLNMGQAVYNQQQVIGETVVVYNMVPIRAKHTIRGAVITLRDLTEFQKVAEELTEVKNYTQALRAQSHEFVNKMQSLSGLIQLGRYEKALVLLHETTESHQGIISQLSKAFPNSAVSGILLGKFNRAKELDIQFTIDSDSSIPATIQLPDNELVCIIGNLIENAFEALQQSGQPERAVWVKVKPVRGFLRIAVADNGPGIAPAIKKKIYQRGFTTKNGPNKGIGLSLVKQCVENLRGTIRFHNGHNLIFIAKIPLKNGGLKQ